MLLDEKNGVWTNVSASKVKPASGTFLSGTVEYVNGVNDGIMNINYGIEQYFVERNAIVPTQNITVHARVDGSGQARIVELYQNGAPVNITYRSTD